MKSRKASLETVIDAQADVIVALDQEVRRLRAQLADNHLLAREIVRANNLLGRR